MGLFCVGLFYVLVHGQVAACRKGKALCIGQDVVGTVGRACGESTAVQWA